MQPFCQLEKELSGEDGARYPQPVCWGGPTPTGNGDCYILPGVADLLGCGAQKDWWQEKVLGDPVSWFKLLD